MIQKNWVYICRRGPNEGRRYQVLLATSKTITAVCLDSKKRVYLSPSSFKDPDPLYATKYKLTQLEDRNQLTLPLRFPTKNLV